MGDLTFTMTRDRANELGLLVCECGHPHNNHFSHSKARPCAHCSCKSLRERGVAGTKLVEPPKPDPRDARIAELEAALAGLVNSRAIVDEILDEDRRGKRSFDRGSQERREAIMAAYGRAKEVAERALRGNAIDGRSSSTAAVPEASQYLCLRCGAHVPENVPCPCLDGVRGPGNG